MGRQVNFFLSRKDQLTVDQALKSIPNLQILKGITADTLPQEVATSEISIFGEEPLALLLSMRSATPSLSMSKAIGNRGFAADSYSAPVIDFDRCYIGTNYIRSGRIYYNAEFWLADEKWRKPEEFLVWASQVFKVFRKCLTKVGDTGYFAGQDAQSLRSRGWLFDPVDVRK